MSVDANGNFGIFGRGGGRGFGRGMPGGRADISDALDRDMEEFLLRDSARGGYLRGGRAGGVFRGGRGGRGGGGGLFDDSSSSDGSYNYSDEDPFEGYMERGRGRGGGSRGRIFSSSRGRGAPPSIPGRARMVRRLS